MWVALRPDVLAVPLVPEALRGNLFYTKPDRTQILALLVTIPRACSMVSYLYWSPHFGEQCLCYFQGRRFAQVSQGV